MIGHPISHSVSPQMHNAALAALAEREPRFRDWRYHAFDVEPERLGEALTALRARGFRGINLTVPHKVVAMDLVSSVDAGARDAGAVNTLAAEDGGWRGFNTDGYGLVRSLDDDLQVGLRGRPVVLLGAGGAARGAALACLEAGCSQLLLVNRSPPNLQRLLGHLRPLKPEETLLAAWPAEGGTVPAGTILINATSAGLKSGDAAPVDLTRYPGVAAVYDMIYNPPVTALLRQAAALPGVRHANGLGMLVHQGAKALEIWTGTLAARHAPIMRAAAAKALGSAPGSGADSGP